MYFVITVDTEADNQWQKKMSTDLDNINHLPRFQELCSKYNFSPTYLITYEVADNDNAVSLLKSWQEKGEVEIGAHLHPWTNPPFVEFDKTEQAFPSELEEDLLHKKLKKLTEKIKEKFDKAPKSFRAGRWGFDDRVAKHLFALGYKTDCSISPRVSWQKYKGLEKGNGGPDFRKHIAKPYYFDSGLLEVPMTILYTGIFSKEGNLTKWFSRLPDSFAKKVFNKLFFQLKWCRVFSKTTIDDLKRVYKSAKKNNLPVIEFMIHSSELMPGGSPYAKTEKDVDEIYKKLEGFFKYLQSQKVKGVTLSNFAEKYNQ